MATTFTPGVVREAFENTIGARVAPSALTECADEFFDSYRDVGVEEAFKGAIEKFAPKIDFTDRLFVRFENALKTAQEAADHKKAADKAEEERRKAQEAITSLEGYRTSAKELQSEIAGAARSARKLARDSNSDAVSSAAESVTEISHTADDLVRDLDGTARDAREAARNGMLATVEAAVETAKSTYDRIKGLLGDAQEGLETTKAATLKAKNQQAEEQKVAAIKKATDSSAADLSATEQAAQAVKTGVSAYKVDVARQTGADPTDNPDELVTNANKCVANARDAHKKAVEAAVQDNKTDAEEAAKKTADARKEAEKILNDLNDRVAKARTEAALNEAKEEGKKKVQAKTEEEKAKTFTSRWLRPRIPALVMFVVALMLAIAALIVIDTPAQVTILVAMLVLALAAWALYKSPADALRTAVAALIGAALLFGAGVTVLQGVGAGVGHHTAAQPTDHAVIDKPLDATSVPPKP